MPTYEYKCLACGHHFEMFQKMKDEPIKKCPKCEGKVKRLIGAGAGTIFKGSGFYQTDYKNAKSPSKGSRTKPSGSKEK
ncbi:MAG TPA: FmdB family zinc ribbon protein [Ignavibacteriaceae bacterium]